MILGLRVRILDVDETVAIDNTGLTGEGLKAAVEEDHARGLHPFVLGECNSMRLVQCLDKYLIVATVGTTSSGAIDRVEDVGATSTSSSYVNLCIARSF